ncbi:MAG: transglutaminase domain-containing protein [Verrucomicrobiota bacterium]
MKTPPLLLGSALLFWGWQAGLLPVAACMAAILEGARLVRERWDIGDEDFTRIWTFCSVLLLGTVVYAFTSNEGPMRLGNWFRAGGGPPAANAALAGSTQTASMLFRWLPMIYFLLVAAQVYSTRDRIPATVFSKILVRRLLRAERLGRPHAAPAAVNLAYPYFGLCLFAASNHPSDSNRFFWGFCVLVAWALWTIRSSRFRPWFWIASLGLAVALGFVGQIGLNRLQSYVVNLNPQWLSRFMRRGVNPRMSPTQISLNAIGRLQMSGRVVIRLEPGDGNVPEYLREASYRRYRGTVWQSGQNSEDSIPESGVNTGTWQLVVGKTNTSSVRISCYLEDRTKEGENTGVLPLPSGCSRLENLMAYSLKQNDLGAVTAVGPGLISFDAFYGPGATLDSPPDTNRFYNEDKLAPYREWPALDKVIAELGLGEMSYEQQLQAIQTFFESRFTYSTWLGGSPGGGPNETPLSRFLLRTRRGHCEYFATATVLMLQRLGVPARYAVGYVVHEHSGNQYVVRLRDAHAWCLVWNPKTQTWDDFDTTPPSWIEEESRHASPLESISDFMSWLWYQFSRFRWGQTHLRQYLLIGLIPVLLLLLLQIIFRQRRKRRAALLDAGAGGRSLPGLDSEFYRVEAALARRRGATRPSDETLGRWLQRAGNDPGVAANGNDLRRLLGLHYQYRFDPRSLEPRERAELQSGCQEVLRKFEG